jgi:hypothetical protein
VLPRYSFPFRVTAPVVRVLDLHPATLAREVAARQLLRDDALESELADRREEREPVIERLRGRPAGAVELEAFERGSTLFVGLGREVDTVLPEHAKITEVSATDMSRFRTRRQTSGKYGSLPFQATSSPSSMRPVGSLRSSGSTGVMFQPLRLRTDSPSSVETIARKPSHLRSKDHPEPGGRGPG